MKTKAEIVQQLLNDGKITAEDAVILLMDSKQVQFVPYYPTYPYNPYPFWQYITSVGPTYSTGTATITC